MNQSYRQLDKTNIGSVGSSYLQLDGTGSLKKSRKPNWFKTILIWSLISILWQTAGYYFLNQKISEIMNPNLSSSSNTVSGLQTTDSKETDFALSYSKISEPSVSYDDRYLVFRSGTSLEMYDFNQRKVIWEESSFPNGRILTYQWLPDRDSLLLFISGTGSDPEKPHIKTLTLHSIEIDSTTSQVTDRFAATLPLALQTAQITDVCLSTTTNLLYFCAEQGNRSFLYEVDVMKNVKLLNHAGENIRHLAVSPNTGAVYFNSSTSNTDQIMAFNHSTRVQVASNPHDVVLGLWNQNLYVGTVEGGNLVKIWTTTDNQPSTLRPNFNLYWEGKIPWNSSSKMTMSGYDLLISSVNQLYRISLKKTDTIANSGAPFFSQSGKYYWQVNTDSANVLIKRFKLG